MTDNKEVFQALSNAVNKAMRDLYGPPGSAPENMTAQIAVALLQLSLNYFTATKAPKEVVLDFVLKLLGMDDKAKVEKKEGRLIIVPPTSPFEGFGKGG